MRYFSSFGEGRGTFVQVPPQIGGWQQDDRKGSSLLYVASLPRQFRAEGKSDPDLWWNLLSFVD